MEKFCYNEIKGEKGWHYGGHRKITRRGCGQNKEEYIKSNTQNMVHSKSSRMKYIYAFICFFLLSGVANADKWLCGTSKEKTSYFICGTYLNAYSDDSFRQYFYILDESLLVCLFHHL